MPQTSTIPSFAETVAAQFRFNTMATSRNLDGLTDEESRFLPQPGGNSINWLLGHIIYVRQALLTSLGGERLLSAESSKAYARGSKAVAAMPETLPTLLALYHDSAERLDALFSRLTDEQLSGPAPFHPLPQSPEPSLATLLQKSVCHEAYHAGQIGIVRRLLGKAGVIG